MALAGGLGLTWLRTISRTRLTPVRAALMGGAGITAMEYAIGRRFNRRHQIWDYRRAPRAQRREG